MATGVVNPKSGTHLDIERPKRETKKNSGKKKKEKYSKNRERNAAKKEEPTEIRVVPCVARLVLNLVH